MKMWTMCSHYIICLVFSSGNFFNCIFSSFTFSGLKEKKTLSWQVPFVCCASSCHLQWTACISESGKPIRAPWSERPEASTHLFDDWVISKDQMAQYTSVMPVPHPTARTHGQLKAIGAVLARHYPFTPKDLFPVKSQGENSLFLFSAWVCLHYKG